MSSVYRAQVTKELQKAASSMSNAVKLMSSAEHEKRDVAMVKLLRNEQRILGEMIVALNGGPAITIDEMRR